MIKILIFLFVLVHVSGKPAKSDLIPSHFAKSLSIRCLVAYIHQASARLPSQRTFLKRNQLIDRIAPLAASLANAPADIKINPRRFFKATKQIATLGPASSSFEMIEKLFLSGADVFRLNFSHGEHSEKAVLVNTIRQVEAKYNHPIAILADLQGPKLRVGIFDNDKVTIVDGQKFTFDYKDEPGSAARVRLPHPEILNTLKPGDTILLDDGKLRMKVRETTIGSSGLENGQVICEVINGGNLSNKKGVNTPSIMLPISPLTPKDRRLA